MVSNTSFLILIFIVAILCQGFEFQIVGMLGIKKFLNSDEDGQILSHQIEKGVDKKEMCVYA